MPTQKPGYSRFGLAHAGYPGTNNRLLQINAIYGPMSVHYRHYRGVHIDIDILDKNSPLPLVDRDLDQLQALSSEIILRKC